MAGANAALALFTYPFATHALFAMKDIARDLDVVEALAGTNITSDTDTDGATIDMQGFEAVMLAVQIGPYTDGDYEVVVQHAADDGNGNPDTWEDAPDSELLGSENTLSTSGIFKIGYRGVRRFVRVRITSTSTATGAYAGALAVKGHGRRAPYQTQTRT